MSMGHSEEENSRKEDKAPNFRPGLGKPEKVPRTADSGSHILEAAAPSPTLAVL